MYNCSLAEEQSMHYNDEYDALTITVINSNNKIFD